MSELKAVHAFDVYEAYTKTGDNDAAQVYLKPEADKVIEELKNRADKLLSCLKCLVMRDLIKDCPEKESAIEIVKEYKNVLG